MYVVKPFSRLAASRRPYFHLTLGLALACVVVGCSKDEPAPGAAAPGSQAAQAVAPPQPAVSAEVAAMGADQLRESASTALREQRLYAPAGNNAMEYYLALRDKQPNDPAVASALTDLQPYALIATEQSIGREDFVEAQRLYALMEKTDPQAPALPRLKTSIAAAQQAVAQRAVDEKTRTEEEAKRLADLEKQRAAQQQQEQQRAAAQLAQQQSAAAPAAPAPDTAAQAAAAQREADRRAAEQRAAQQAAAAAPAPPPPAAASASSDLRPISMPQPRYPAAALRARQSGQVQVEFTVAPDGSVSAARVVSAQPDRVFDREAVAAVKRWRFQPVDSPVTTRRTIAFNPGN
ncbi:energy transducer TonB [Luteimonas sp. SX5]|uniref:Protein TonB n=1 Tax=Luteimonas galliterrae TaxID=2940486 RepID=A0ABT0MM77_9GAMM|nr:energy transducer TonB [Luteimonas galliterrae]MCL1635988.1 energy transducer TonB [Luteimonas galliterrae]